MGIVIALTQELENWNLNTFINVLSATETE